MRSRGGGKDDSRTPRRSESSLKSRRGRYSAKKRTHKRDDVMRAHARYVYAREKWANGLNGNAARELRSMTVPQRQEWFERVAGKDPLDEERERKGRILAVVLFAALLVMAAVVALTSFNAVQQIDAVWLSDSDSYVIDGETVSLNRKHGDIRVYIQGHVRNKTKERVLPSGTELVYGLYDGEGKLVATVTAITSADIDYGARCTFMSRESITHDVLSKAETFELISLGGYDSVFSGNNGKDENKPLFTRHKDYLMALIDEDVQGSEASES